MSRDLEITTGLPILIDDIGLVVSVVPLYTIPPERYWYFASSSDIDGFIDSGAIIVRHDGIAFNACDG